MIDTIKTTNENEQYAIHPTKFVLWLIIVASVMLFAAFTSGYIVRRGEGNWLIFDLPNLFSYNTIIIIASSITMQWAYFMAKKDNLKLLKIALLITFRRSSTLKVVESISIAVRIARSYSENVNPELCIITSGNLTSRWTLALMFLRNRGLN